MDLGAALCRPTNPKCGECPVARSCAWHQSTLDQSTLDQSLQADPALGSSGVSGTQGRFEGSDRQARGRLMRALSAGPVERTQVAGVMQRSPATAERLLTDLAGEGLCQIVGTGVRLPE